MQKKFLRTFAILIVFIGVIGTIGQDSAKGMYVDALEEEVIINQCRNLVCKQIDMGYWKRAERNDEDGWQAHKCERCDTYEGGPKRFGPPLFTIERSGIQPKLMITYEAYECKHPIHIGMCKNPKLIGKLKLIWDIAERVYEHRYGNSISSEIHLLWKRGLESLWAAARLLDQPETETDYDFFSSSPELTQYSFPEIVSESHHKCGCCCTIM